MVAQATVTVQLKGVKRLHDALKLEAAGIAGPLDRVFVKWGARYRSFVQLRFNAHSRGGGDWPDLAPSTIARRRKGKGTKKFKKGSVAILRDTSLMFMALSPVFKGQPGAINKRKPFGVTVGYGGPQRHPGGGTATIADIASFHQEGNKYLPQRKIIVDAPSYVTDGMKSDLKTEIMRLRGIT